MGSNKSYLLYEYYLAEKKLKMAVLEASDIVLDYGGKFDEEEKGGIFFCKWQG